MTINPKRSESRFYFFILSLLSLSAFLAILGSEAVEIDLDDAGIFFSVAALVLLAQSVALQAGHHLLRLFLPAHAANYLLVGGVSVAFAANLYFFAFRVVDVTHRSQVYAALIGGALLAIALTLARRSDTARSLVTAFAVVTIVISLGQYAYERVAIASLDGYALQPLSVQSARNVYVIGFESLHSPKAFRDLYGITDLPHVDYLQSRGFRVFDSSYSADMRTRRTYSRILEFMRPLEYDDFEERTVFSAPNTTSSSFRSSGYNTQFLYKTNHFAVEDGTFDYRYPPDAFYSCSFLPRDYFYYLCHRRVVNFLNRHLYRQAPIGTRQQIDHFKGRVDTVVASGKPWLTILHVGYPFHSRGDHDYRDADAVADFRKRIAASIPQVDKWVQESISYLLAKDPKALVIVIGDHGAELTRGLDLEVLPHDEARDRYFSTEQEIEDRYGAMLGVYPADFCSRRIVEGSSTSYLMEQLIACLNNDNEPSPKEIKRARTIFINNEPVDVRTYVPPRDDVGRD